MSLKLGMGGDLGQRDLTIMAYNIGEWLPELIMGGELGHSAN